MTFLLIEVDTQLTSKKNALDSEGVYLIFGAVLLSPTREYHRRCQA
jgi:hypothetical protein